MMTTILTMRMMMKMKMTMLFTVPTMQSPVANVATAKSSFASADQHIFLQRPSWQHMTNLYFFIDPLDNN